MNVKERIIKTLLTSQKTTGQIAVALGKTDRQYNAVDKDLKTLQSKGFIHYSKIKQPGQRGPVPKTYDIVYKLDRLVELCSQYPVLLQDLQASDKIRDMILEKFDYFEGNEELYNGFRLKLLVSPTFFKWCLLSDVSKFEDVVISSKVVSSLGQVPDNLFEHIENSNLKIKPDPNCKPINTEHEDDIYLLFHSCCVTDAFKGLQPNETTLTILEQEFTGHETELKIINYLRSCNS